MIYLRQKEGQQFESIEKLSDNSIRMPFRLHGIEFGEQRNYKVTISISCSGPKNGKVKSSEIKVLRKREEADLFYTTNDADWIYNSTKKYFNKKGYDSGKKEKHIRLVNPNLSEISEAFIATGQYFKSMAGRKDWAGGELTVIYAGHGFEEDGALCISGHSLNAKNLIEIIIANLPLTDQRCRIDLLLDSCFSGAFIANFIDESQKYSDVIFPFDMFGSCLHDESSLESSEWEHGIFTYSFKKNDEIDPFIEPKNEFLLEWQTKLKSSLFQGGVTFLSEGEQHAFNWRAGDLKVYGSTRFFNVSDEIGKNIISANDLFKMMDKQREEVKLIDFEKPYSKELFMGLF